MRRNGSGQTTFRKVIGKLKDLPTSNRSVRSVDGKLHEGFGRTGDLIPYFFTSCALQLWRSSMPILAQNKEKYPPDWREISDRIRFDRAGGRCECEGECGLHCHPPRRCDEWHGKPASYAKGSIVLTVAHLNHEESDCVDDNLKAMCQRCHLRYDRYQHRQNARTTRMSKKAIGDLWEQHPDVK